MPWLAGQRAEVSFPWEVMVSDGVCLGHWQLLILGHLEEAAFFE